MAVAVGAAIAYVALKAPVYEASAQIRVGQVAGQGLFEAGDLMSSRLLLQYGEFVADGVRRPRPFIRAARPSKNAQGIVEIVSEADSPEDAARHLSEVVAAIRKEHDAIFDRNARSLNERLQRVELQRNALQDQYRELTDLIPRMREANPVQASLLAVERSRLLASSLELDAEQPKLIQMLSPPQTRPTELVAEVSAPTKPAAPKKALVLVLAVALGSLGGVFLAFVAEFFFGGRSRAAERSD